MAGNYIGVCDLSLTTVTPTGGTSAALADILAAILRGVDAGLDTTGPTNGVFGLGVGVVAATDFGLVTDVRAAVSDWGLVTDAITTTIDLGVIGS